MLSPEKHCELLSANVRHRGEAMVAGFRLFVQLYSAIVGGSLALRLQYGAKLPQYIASHIVSLSDGLALFVALATLILVGDSFRAWHGQRARLSEVAGRNESGNLIIPKPLWQSGITFAVMVAVIVGAPFLFCMFNPLKVSQ